jgi:hypothetical protein
MVQVADSGAANDINIALPRGSAITGTITDEAGDPVEGATVRVLKLTMVEGRQTALPPQGPGRSARTIVAATGFTDCCRGAISSLSRSPTASISAWHLAARWSSILLTACQGFRPRRCCIPARRIRRWPRC